MGLRVDAGLAGVVYEAMTVVARHPALALPAARLLGHGVVVGVRSDLVIEGFPRSGNSLTVAAFAAAQPRPVRVAHHTHAPANVLRAVRLLVPALVVVRDPDEAVVEFVVSKPALGLVRALRGYARFHEPLLARRRAIVVGTFPEVTTHLSGVVRRLNRRFGTGFAEPGDEALEAAGASIAGYWAHRRGPGLPVVGRTAHDAEDDEARRARLRERLLAPDLAPLRERARRSYASIVAGDGNDPPAD